MKEHNFAGTAYLDKEYYYTMEHYLTAEESYHALLKSGVEDRRIIARIHHYLGKLYNDMGRYNNAQEEFSVAFALQTECFGEYCYQNAAILNEVAVSFIALGELQRAWGYLERADVLDPEDEDTMQQLAIIYSKFASEATDFMIKAHYNQLALEKYNIALKLKIEKYGPTHPTTALTICGIGDVYYNDMRYAEALVQYDEALTIQVQTYAAFHPEIAATYYNFAKVYQELGLHSKALSMCFASLDILIKAYGMDHPDVAKLLSKIADNYNACESYQEAQYYYIAAREIFYKFFLPMHSSIISIDHKLNAIDETFERQSLDLQSQYAYLNQAISLQGYYSIEHAEALHYLGMTHLNLGDYQEALSLQMQALKIDAETNLQNILTGEIYLEIANIYYHLNDYKTALEYYDFFVRMVFIQVYQANHIKWANLNSFIADCHRELEHYDLAAQYYAQAQEILQKPYLGEDDPQLVSYLATQIELLETLRSNSIFLEDRSRENFHNESPSLIDYLLSYEVLNLGKSAVFAIKNSIMIVESLLRGALTPTDNPEETVHDISVNAQNQAILLCEQLDEMQGFLGSRMGYNYGIAPGYGFGGFPGGGGGGSGSESLYARNESYADANIEFIVINFAYNETDTSI